MKINTTTLFLTALMLTTAAQTALGMNGLQNNTYVKYGAAIVTGVTLGAGLMYYFTSKPEEIDQEKCTDVITPKFKKIALSFDIGEKQTYISRQFTREKTEFQLPSITQTFWTKSSNLEVIMSARSYYLSNIGIEGIRLTCESKEYSPKHENIKGLVFTYDSSSKRESCKDIRFTYDSKNVELLFLKPDPQKNIRISGCDAIFNTSKVWGNFAEQYYIATSKSDNCLCLTRSDLVKKQEQN